MKAFAIFGAALGAALLLPGAAQAQAQPVPGAPKLRPDATAAADVRREALGLELAQLLNSEALTRAQSLRMMNETLPRTFSSSPQFAAMEKQYPGITQAIIDAMSPVIVAGTLARLPDLWHRLAPVYGDTFTAEELRDVIAFYRSPLGTRIIQIMGEEADFSSVVAEAMRNPGGQISEKAIGEGIDAGSAGLIRRLSNEDVAKASEFMATPTGRKVAEIAPRAQQVAAEWGNDTPPELEQQVQAAVLGVMQKYTGEKPKP